jgi:hypothetical protein
MEMGHLEGEDSYERLVLESCRKMGCGDVNWSVL